MQSCCGWTVVAHLHRKHHLIRSQHTVHEEVMHHIWPSKYLWLCCWWFPTQGAGAGQLCSLEETLLFPLQDECQRGDGCTGSLCLSSVCQKGTMCCHFDFKNQTHAILIYIVDLSDVLLWFQAKVLCCLFFWIKRIITSLLSELFYPSSCYI